VLIGALALSEHSYALIMPLATLLGMTAQGAQAGLNAVAAACYPTPIRSTGLGWASAVGRVGSIMGPLFGGLMLSLQWSVQSILLSAAIPASCAALALAIGRHKLHAATLPPALPT
jgi:AAHS family 4-hydroxybenzoate transporter-like MFS transporter